MFALTVLLILAVYVLISLGAIWTARAVARRRGRRPWVWGWVAAIAMYHLVFWDLIPTAILYPWYQAKDAGVWVYKTPAQWRLENEEVVVVNEKSADWTSVSSAVRAVHINSRFLWQRSEERRWPDIRRVDYTINDVETGEVVARKTFFRSGDCRAGQVIRFWVIRCDDRLARTSDVSFDRTLEDFRAIGGDSK